MSSPRPFEEPSFLLHPDCTAWLCEGKRVLVGLSGGRDSTALLLALHHRGIPLATCHIHHGIRGAEADRDACFSRVLAERLGIEHREVRIDVPALADKHKLSLETAARHARHKALRQCALACGCQAVALAHHADDQAETVLFRICRGAGGLKGMRAVSRAPGGLVLLRPLLNRTRAEITAWLREIGQTWCDDSTNAAPCCARNILRGEVMPALERAMGRSVTPVLTRSARLCEETEEALAAALDALRPIDPQGRLYLPKITTYPKALQKAILHRYMVQCAVSNCSEKAVMAMQALLSPDAPSRCTLAKGVTARRKEKRIWLENAAGERLMPQDFSPGT